MNSRLRRRLSTSVEGLGDLRLSRKGLWPGLCPRSFPVPGWELRTLKWTLRLPSLSGAHSLNRVERKWGSGRREGEDRGMVRGRGRR